MKNRRLIFVCLAGLSVVGGLAGLLYFKKPTDAETRREKEMKTSINTVNKKDREELRERIEAMTPEELAIVVECIPVNLCMARIHSELDRAANLEKSIKNMIDIMEK